MASGVTNRFKREILAAGFRGNGSGKLVNATDFKLKLINNGGTPNPDDETWTEWDVTRAFNEVTGGSYAELTVADTSVGFDVSDESDGSDYGRVQMADQSWTAVATSITDIYYALLMDDNATPGSRNVYVWWDLAGPHTVTAGSTLTVQDAEVRIT